MPKSVLHSALTLFAIAGLLEVVGCAKPDPIEEAGDSYKQAHDLSGRGHPDQAIPYYNSAIRLNPKFVAAYNERGIARLRTGDLPGSTADFDRAIELDPHYAD